MKTRLVRTAIPAALLLALLLPAIPASAAQTHQVRPGEALRMRLAAKTNGSGAPAAISVAGVSHTYGRGRTGEEVRTLESVSLDIRKGELLCLIGPSGCGKSTLLNIIGGLVGATAGEVRIDGRAIAGTTPDRIAYVFQENTLFPWNTIADNIKVALEFQGVPRGDRQERAEEALNATRRLIGSLRIVTNRHVDLRSGAAAEQHPQTCASGDQDQQEQRRARDTLAPAGRTPP